MSYKYFECGCLSRDHLIRAYLDEDDTREEPLDLIGLDFVLRIGPDWMDGRWNRLKWRLKTAFKILFGIKVVFRECWEIPLGIDKRVQKLVEFLQTAIDNVERKP